MNNKLTDGMVLEAINGISCGNGNMAYLRSIVKALKEDQPGAFPQGTDPVFLAGNYLDGMFSRGILVRSTGPEGLEYSIRGDVI